MKEREGRGSRMSEGDDYKWLDDWSEELDEGELNAMQRAAVKSDLEALERDLEYLRDRMKYYGEGMTLEQLEDLLVQVKRAIATVY